MTGQQLKNSILQEAIEGRLVPQDPNDEPASVLLERIRAEKARLVKEKKIKKDKNESRIYRTEDGHWMEHFEDKNREDICIDEEIPFDIPDTWEWCRLRNIVSILGDGIHGTPEYDATGEYYFINGNNLSNNRIVIKENTERVNKEEYNKYKKELNKNTILVSINGTIGNVGYYNGEPVILGKSACYFNLMDILLKPYTTLLMYTDYFLKYAKENATGSTIKNVSLMVMKNFLFPRPPYAEQHRIVEKIESLLPKVEAYGKAQEELEKLNEALPEQLKKSILQEAIEGRLVPQDPNDEPASVLLERIRTEKARLVKEKKIKKDKNESRIYRTDDGHWMEYFEDKSREDICIDEEIPFDVPNGWEWCRLGIYAYLYTGNSISKEEKARKYTNVKGRWYIGTKDVGFDSCIDYENGIYIPEKDETNFKIAPVNSILMCIEGGSAGRKIGIIDRDVCFGNKLCCIYPYANNNPYLYYYLQSQSFKESFESNKKGIIGGVSINNLMPILIPLPPLAEQHRIVEKLEEILPKLNELKKETDR